MLNTFSAAITAKASRHSGVGGSVGAGDGVECCVPIVSFASVRLGWFEAALWDEVGAWRASLLSEVSVALY